ncbi:hypothetical protein M0802_012782 [Mischocyttarus mexicanus]|nr:hypothetical protein M0802_012782 [Mischocyttarus mexicanus]
MVDSDVTLKELIEADSSTHSCTFRIENYADFLIAYMTIPDRENSKDQRKYSHSTAVPTVIREPLMTNRKSMVNKNRPVGGYYRSPVNLPGFRAQNGCFSDLTAKNFKWSGM